MKPWHHSPFNVATKSGVFIVDNVSVTSRNFVIIYIVQPNVYRISASQNMSSNVENKITVSTLTLTLQLHCVHEGKAVLLNIHTVGPL